MSNPYGNDPYGNQGQNPYGQGGQPSPYGAGQFPGGPAEPAKTDGVSIAALVSSLLCCSPVALILGFIGIGRTKGGQRKGRGMAIAGVVLGAIGLLATIGVVVWAFVFASGFITLDDAEVGQCANVEEEDGDVVLREKECSEEHDAEIVHVGTVGEDNAGSQLTTDVCINALSEGDLTAISDALGEDAVRSIQVVTEDPASPDADDKYACYIEPGEKLTEKIL
ncbi:MAG TPA: DUF4190 domain-containing protein [Nocardioides sp.]|nr:DUF4190 domain-containing protein [Nocardioides sp.]